MRRLHGYTLRKMERVPVQERLSCGHHSANARDTELFRPIEATARSWGFPSDPLGPTYRSPFREVRGNYGLELTILSLDLGPAL